MASPKTPKDAAACPKCKEPAVVASERFGIQTLFCPGCDHSWEIKPTSQK